MKKLRERMFVVEVREDDVWIHDYWPTGYSCRFGMDDDVSIQDIRDWASEEVASNIVYEEDKQ